MTILLSILVLPLSCKRDSTTGPQEGGTPVRLALGQSPDTKLSGMDYALQEEAVSHWAFFIFERSTRYYFSYFFVYKFIKFTI